MIWYLYIKQAFRW